MPVASKTSWSPELHHPMSAMTAMTRDDGDSYGTEGVPTT